MPIIPALTVAIMAAGTTYAISSSQSQAKAAKTAANIAAGRAQALTGTVDPATTVDPNTNANGITNVNQLGRAALISTSPQGVKGTDETGRYRLLGN